MEGRRLGTKSGQSELSGAQVISALGILGQQALGVSES